MSNQVDTSTGTVNLRATFANTDAALFPNEFVNIHLLVDTLQNATLVPSPAVQGSGAPGSYVYVVNPDDTVSVQTVTTGPTDGTNTVITKGLGDWRCGGHRRCRPFERWDENFHCRAGALIDSGGGAGQTQKT